MMGQIEVTRQSGMAKAMHWEFEVDKLDVFITFRHRQKPERNFLLRASFDDFPRRPPSCVFVDPHSRTLTDAAWPPNVKHGGQPPGICTPGTREFHEHYHKRDAQYAWSAERYPLLDTLERIQKLIENWS